VKAGWETMPLQALCNDFKQDIVDGPFGSDLQRKDYLDDGIPVLKIQNIKPFVIELKKMDYVSPAKFQELKRHSFRRGDIVLTKLGCPLGVSAIVEDVEEGVIVADLVRIRAQKVNTRYLCYHLNSQNTSDFINAMQKGTTRPRVTLSVVRDLPIALPSPAEQQRIVRVLDETFVGISAAKANAETNLQNARGLFESYLHRGDAERVPLADLVEIKTGKLNANAAVEGGQYPFFTCSREIYAIDDYAFDCEAILLAGNNAVGDFNVKHYKGKFNAYQRTYVITVNKNNRVLYRFLYFQLLKSLKKFKAQSVGVGTKFLKLGMIKDMEIELPNLAEQRQIVSTIDSIRQQTEALESIYQQKIVSLGDLKKSLLHQAFSGAL
jgi:type I restriction enzyme, S subunit